jgi:Flp pilus assembly protein TadD
MNGAVEQLQKAVGLVPTSAEYRFNLGYILETKGDFAAAVGPLQKAAELSKGKNARFLSELAKAYEKTGKFDDAVNAAQQALDLAVQQHNEQQEKNLREALDGYKGEAAAAKPQ